MGIWKCNCFIRLANKTQYSTCDTDGRLAPIRTHSSPKETLHNLLTHNWWQRNENSHGGKINDPQVLKSWTQERKQFIRLRKWITREKKKRKTSPLAPPRELVGTFHFDMQTRESNQWKLEKSKLSYSSFLNVGIYWFLYSSDRKLYSFVLWLGLE